jgi:hypothetical protein
MREGRRTARTARRARAPEKRAVGRGRELLVDAQHASVCVAGGAADARCATMKPAQAARPTVGALTIPASYIWFSRAMLSSITVSKSIGHYARTSCLCDAIRRTADRLLPTAHCYRAGVWRRGVTRHQTPKR